MRIALSELFQRHRRSRGAAATSPAVHTQIDPDACRCYGCAGRSMSAGDRRPRRFALPQTTSVTPLPAGSRAS